jgi:hypothetical protein
VRWEGHVACIREMRNTTNLSGNVKGKVSLGDLGVNGRIILKRRNDVKIYGHDSAGSG